MSPRLVRLLARLLAFAGAGLVFAVVLGLAAYLTAMAWPVLSPRLFFGDVAVLDALMGRRPVWDGIWPACAGTLALVGLSSALAVPVGVAGGIYLSEYARGRTRRFLTLGVDLLAGVPSILMGLFGFAMILLLRRGVWPGANTGLLPAAFCLALLVLPAIVAATAASLAGLPESLRLTGPALGFSDWGSLWRVLLPGAARGILGGVILAVGRAAEDTAVILMTGVVANAGLPGGIWGKFEAVPFYIYYTAAQYRDPEELGRVHGAALALLVMTAGLFAVARGVRRLMERGWTGV